MPDFKLALGALLLLCAGCAVLDPQAASLAAADEALGDALYAARAPQSEQRAALARAQQAFGTEPSDVNRLRVAALLALLAPPLRDPARASELLAPIVNAREPGVGRSAAFLAAALVEQRRLAAEADRLSRESERLAREGERAARERERLDREREKREEGLREQVEALREIERNIQEREEKLRRGQR